MASEIKVDQHTSVELKNKQTLGVQMSYGVGQIAGQLFRDVPSILLLFFMTNILGISAAVAGTSIFVPKLLVGALSDITVGAYIDKWRKRIPLHWWLLFGAIFAPIAMFLLFNVPDIGETGKLVYIIAIVSFYMMVFASFSVPYLAIATAISETAHQRTLLMAWRLVFTALGVLIAAGAAPAFVDAAGGGESAYSQMSLILGGLCFITLMIAFFGVRRAVVNKPDADDADLETKLNIREMLTAVRAPRFSVLVTVYIMQLAGGGMTYAAMLYFLSYVMVLENPFEMIGLIILFITLGIIVGQPIWVFLSKRFSKKNLYIAATILHAVAQAGWALTALEGGIIGAFIFSFFIGIGNSGWTMLGFSMVSDIADEGRAGLYSSVWVAADKIGFGLGGTFLVGVVLSGFGFDSARAVAGLEQSASAITGVTVAFGLAPAVLYCISAFIFYIWGRDTAAP